MVLRAFRAVTVIACASGVLISAAIQAGQSDSAPWRTSFETFIRTIEQLPAAQIPRSTAEKGNVVARRVRPDDPIMKRFGGRVEFEGVFESVVEDWPGSAPEKTRPKIEMRMAWPKGGPPDIMWTLDVYPSSTSLRGWKALPPQTAIKFTAVVTAIAETDAWIPGANIRPAYIQLEGAEVVSIKKP